MKNIVSAEEVKSIKHLINENVFICGFGPNTINIIKILNDNGIHIKGFFVDGDKNKLKQNVIESKIYNDGNEIFKNIYSKQELLDKFDSFTTIIGFMNYKNAKNMIENDIELKNKGNIFYIKYFMHGIFDNNYYESNKIKFDETRELLYDKKSKEIYDAYIHFKRFGELEPLVNYCEFNQYFPDFIKLEKNEVFIDGGGYIGDTAEEFINKTNGIYEHIYIFEPDPINYQKINPNLKNTTIIKKGLWDKEEILYFTNESNSASYISNNNNGIKIHVTNIDAILNNNRATFIKMDIEGSELKALQGAKNTIATYLPKLAISIYHKNDDMLTILPYLNEIAHDKYKLYLRHHSHYANETVLYAIPNI